MFFRVFSYLQFLIKSTNQHGVHSPFVFDFVSKGLYGKSADLSVLESHPFLKKLSKKEQKLMAKILFYFKIKTIEPSFKKSKNYINKEGHLVYFDNLANTVSIPKDLKSGSVFVIIHRIHHSKQHLLKWKEIIQFKKATVTIDLFYFGLLFFRKEQAKEHFKIRV